MSATNSRDEQASCEAGLHRCTGQPLAGTAAVLPFQRCFTSECTSTRRTLALTMKKAVMM